MHELPHRSQHTPKLSRSVGVKGLIKIRKQFKGCGCRSKVLPEQYGFIQNVAERNLSDLMEILRQMCTSRRL